MPGREMAVNALVGTLVTGACAITGSIIGASFQRGLNNTMAPTPDPLDLSEPASGATIGFEVGAAIGMMVSYFALRRRRPVLAEGLGAEADEVENARQDNLIEDLERSGQTRAEDPRSPSSEGAPVADVNIDGARAVQVSGLEAVRSPV